MNHQHHHRGDAMRSPSAFRSALLRSALLSTSPSRLAFQSLCVHQYLSFPFFQCCLFFLLTVFPFSFHSFILSCCCWEFLDFFFFFFLSFFLSVRLARACLSTLFQHSSSSSVPASCHYTQTIVVRGHNKNKTFQLCSNN